MTKTKATAASEDVEQTMADGDTLTDFLFKPDVSGGEKPADYLFKPDATDTEPVEQDKKNNHSAIKSNVIDGKFEEKRPAVEETDPPADQGKSTRKTPEIEGQAPTEQGRIRFIQNKTEKAPVDKKIKPEAEKPKKTTRSPRMPKGHEKEKQSKSIGAGAVAGKSADKGETPAPAEPEPPKDAPRYNEYEHIVYLRHEELFPFKDHPFQIRNDDAMKALVTSVKERGVDQPALVRPRDDGGFEIVAGHRRQKASEIAGYVHVPCVIRNMTDDETVLAMTVGDIYLLSRFNRADIIGRPVLYFVLDAFSRMVTGKLYKKLRQANLFPLW